VEKWKAREKNLKKCEKKRKDVKKCEKSEAVGVGWRATWNRVMGGGP
jgi:hypothetical protein